MSVLGISSFKDIRFRRTLDDIIFPVKKDFVKTRNFSYLRFVLADKGKSVLLATFPRSGLQWTGTVLEYCIMKRMNRTYSVRYEGEGPLKLRQKKNFALFTPADSRSRDSKKIRDIFPGIDIDYCLHSHGAWKDSPLWGLDSSRTIIITRNIPTTLFSFYITKRQIRNYPNGFQGFLEEVSLNEIIKFYNSWGDFCGKKGAMYKIFRYEDMKKDPVLEFSSIFEYIFREKPDPCIVAEAVEDFSFEKQKAIEFEFEKNEDFHSHYRGSSDYTDQIPVESMSYILSEINKRLKHSFGYKY